MRNHRASNNMRAMQVGEEAFFYHSNADPTGIAGVAEVVSEAYPDPTARNPESQYFDPKATEENPRWYMVDVKFKRKFEELIPLAELKKTPGLEDMMVTKRGQRLSIQPVKPEEWEIILKMAR